MDHMFKRNKSDLDLHDEARDRFVDRTISTTVAPVFRKTLSVVSDLKNYLRIAVIGATGRLGHEIVREALRRKHRVLALVRNPDKFDMKMVIHEMQDESGIHAAGAPKLMITKCNVFDTLSMVPLLAGADIDVIISCLGNSGVASMWSSNLYHESAQKIAAAMALCRIPRLIVTSVWGSGGTSSSLPATVNLRLKGLLLGNQGTDRNNMEQFLKEQRQLNYTIVRLPQLSLAEPDEDPNALQSPKANFLSASCAEEMNQEEMTTVKVAIDSSHVPFATKYNMPRLVAAKFILDCAEDQSTRWHKQVVAIGL